MRKKIVKIMTLLLAAAMVLSTAACGERETVSTSSEGDVSVSGKTIKTTNISALCPEGWGNIELEDTTSSEENAVLPNELKFVKGGSSEQDTETNAYVDIVYYSANQDIMQIDPNQWFESVATLDAIQTGDTTWSGYTGLSLGVPFAYVYTQKDDAMVEVWLYTREGSENAAAITDADVLAILQSITV